MNKQIQSIKNKNGKWDMIATEFILLKVLRCPLKKYHDRNILWAFKRYNAWNFRPITTPIYRRYQNMTPFLKNQKLSPSEKSIF